MGKKLTIETAEVFAPLLSLSRYKALGGAKAVVNRIFLRVD